MGEISLEQRAKDARYLLEGLAETSASTVTVSTALLRQLRELIGDLTWGESTHG